MQRRSLAALLLLVLAAACSEGQDQLVGPAPDDAALVDPIQGGQITAPINLFDFWTPTPTRVPLRPARAMTPTTLEATLFPGQTVPEHKDVSLPASPPMGDVVFSMDLTGSMWQELDNVKANALAIMSAVATNIPDAWFGVISYADYNGTYRSIAARDGCDYYSTYGGGGDYPYRLGQAVTDNQGLVTSALNGLPRLSGYDGPESYLRAFYETYADPNLAWRDGAKRIVVNFGDNIPHDCAVFRSGKDPGRDNIVGTADDLTIADVQQGLIDNNVTLIHLNSGGSFAWWSGFAAATGGVAYQINSNGTFPGGVDPATQIADLIQAQVSKVNNLTLKMCAGSETFAPWLQSVSPASVGPVNLPFDQAFDIVVGPPAGTAPGDYTFDICAIGDGAEYGRQIVTIHVPPPLDADAGEDATVECAGCPSMFVLDGSGSTDVAYIASYVWTDSEGNVVGTDVIADVELCVGSHTFTLTIYDEAGNSDSDDVTITVLDTTPAEINFTLTETTLWSPNHKLVTVASGISAYDACGSAVTLTFDVTSNEPINSTGDGNTEPDWVVVDNGDGTYDLQLRAERKGNATGRIYYITVTAMDEAGNVSTATGEVTVPHDQGKKGG